MMTTGQLLLTAWDWEPSVVVGCAALVAGYALAWWRCGAGPPLPPSRYAPQKPGAPPPSIGGQGGPGGLHHPALFLLSVGILLVALVSPLDVLGDGYLFSVHMAQHLLLIELVPPLLLLGVPPRLFRWLLRWPPADAAERQLRRPWLAWLLGIGTLWLWHAPALYAAALADEHVHILQHLTFLVSATIFWWPVIAPLAERQSLPTWAALGYLVLAALANSTLGILLTFSPPGIYAALQPSDALGILPLLREGWGLTPLEDQRLGGGLMWMAGGLVYLLAIVATLARWYGGSDLADEVSSETAPDQAPEPARLAG